MLIPIALAVCSLGCALAQQDAVPTVVELLSYDSTANQPLAALQDGERVVAAAEDEFAFSAETTDAPVGSVRFLIDGVEVSVDSERPFVIAFQPDSDGGWVVAEEAVLLQTVELRIERGAGDAEEFLAASSGAADRYPAGYTYVSSSDLEIGRDPSNAEQAIGLWFPDVRIPAGASISSAQLEFVARGDGDGGLAVTIRGQMSAAPDPFEEDPDGTGSQAITTRAATDASMKWDIAETDAWSSGDVYRSPDIAPIVQEIVAMQEWRSGSPMAFLVSPASGDGFRRAYSFDGSEDLAPVLHVTYQVDVAPASQVGDAPAAIRVGEHTISAIPYVEPGAGGPAGEGRTVQFLLVTEADAAGSEPVEGDEGHVEPERDQTPEGEGADEGAREQELSAPASEDADPDNGPEGEALGSPEADSNVDPTDPTGSVEAAEGEEQEPRELSDATRRTQYRLEPVQGGSTRGMVLLSAYDQHMSILSVTLAKTPVEPVRVELWQGNCERQVERIAELAPYRPGLGSVTPLNVRSTTLQLGNFSVWVTTDTSEDAVACAEIGSAQ